MNARPFSAYAGAWLLFSIFGCGDLPAIAANVCGNGVQEAGEACDGPQTDGRACAADCAAYVCGTSVTTAAGTSVPSTCPPGRSCGIDGTCYAAKGVLGSGAGALVGAANRFASVQLRTGSPRTVIAQTGDFLGRGKPRFVSFDRDGAVVEDAVLPTSIGALSSVDLERDGAEELFGTIPGGTVVLDVPGDGTVSPRSYATFSALPGTTRIAPIARPTETYADGLLLSTESPPDGSLQIVAFPQDPTQSAPVARFPGSADALLATAALPDAIAEMNSGCSPLIFALDGQIDVLRVDPCERTESGVKLFQSDERNGKQPLRASPLVRSPLPIVGGPFVLSVDPDAYADVVLIVSLPPGEGSSTGGRGLAVAFGGEDGFGSAPSGPGRTLGVAGRVSIVLRSNARLERPLSLAQFPREPAPAEAFPTDFEWTYAGKKAPGVLLAFERGAGIGRWGEAKSGDGSGALVFTIGYTRQSPWTSVALGSINGDDLPDVVGGSADESDFDVLTSSSGPLFSVSSVPTNARIEQLAIADFDGDLVNDVAFSSSDVDSAGATNATLSVVYGRALALPDPRVTVGRYPNATIQQVVGSQFGFADASVDFGSELAVVLASTNATASKETVSVLRGDGNRLPLAPLSLTAPMGLSADTITAVVARAASTNGAPRFVMVGDGRANGVDIWETDASFGVIRGGPLGDCALPTVGGETPRLRRADAVAIDLDADGLDEVAVAADCGLDGDDTTLFVLSEQAGRWAVRGGTDRRPLRDPSGGGSNPRQVSLSAGDVDLDGVPDVIAQVELQVQTGPGPGERRNETRTLVYFGGGGTLAASPLEIRANDEAIVATSFLSLVSNASPRLVAATRNGVFLAKTSAAPGTVELEPLPLPDDAGVGRPGNEIRALFGGDFTGDAVDDLVLGNADGFQLFPGLAGR